jgi:hypothetical protein
MGSCYMGYHYDRPKRGNGQKLEWEDGVICSITKKSALEVKRQLIAEGVHKDNIQIRSN